MNTQWYLVFNKYLSLYAIGYVENVFIKCLGSRNLHTVALIYGTGSLLRINCPFRRYGNHNSLSRNNLSLSLSLSLFMSLSSTITCNLAFAIHNSAPCRAAFSEQKQWPRRRPLVIALWQSKSKANCSPCL